MSVKSVLVGIASGFKRGFLGLAVPIYSAIHDTVFGLSVDGLARAIISFFDDLKGFVDAVKNLPSAYHGFGLPSMRAIEKMAVVGLVVAFIFLRIGLR